VFIAFLGEVQSELLLGSPALSEGVDGSFFLLAAAIAGTENGDRFSSCGYFRQQVAPETMGICPMAVILQAPAAAIQLFIKKPDGAAH